MIEDIKTILTRLNLDFMAKPTDSPDVVEVWPLCQDFAEALDAAGYYTAPDFGRNCLIVTTA